MLLPQSSAFAALKNRLNSVSSIGYLHIPRASYVPAAPRTPTGTTTHSVTHHRTGSSQGSSYDRPPRLKGREEGIIRWNELLEKFRSVQERARRAQGGGGDGDNGPQLGMGELRASDGLDVKAAKNTGPPPVPVKDPVPPAAAPTKQRTGLGKQLGRFGGAVSGRGKRNN
jgi:vacuole morphology and inheritance protein 14